MSSVRVSGRRFSELDRRLRGTIGCANDSFMLSRWTAWRVLVLLIASLSAANACHNLVDDSPYSGSGGVAGVAGNAEGGEAGLEDNAGAQSYSGANASPAGSGGEAVQAGTANLEAGASGSPGSGGPLVEDGSSGIEPVIVPGCVGKAGNEPLSFSATSALSASTVFTKPWLYVVYATQPATNVLSLRWMTNNPAIWDSWKCFDYVPYPQRTSAANLSNGSPEVYATTAQGQLFVRRLYSSALGWGQWWPLSLPSPDSQAVDVYAVGVPSATLFLYLVDREKVFVRHRTTSDPFSAYGPWLELHGPDKPMRITAGMRTDGRQQVFVLTRDGALFTAIQSSTETNSSFGPFLPFGGGSPPTSTELQCGYLADGSFVLFSLGSGLVQSSHANFSENAWTTWTVEPGATTHPLETLTIGNQLGQPPTVFGTHGTDLWSHASGSGVWVVL